MRIGADGSHLRWEPTGTRRYLDGLLHSLEKLLPDDELYVYYNSGRGRPMFSAGARERFIRMPNRTLWNQLRVPLALAGDRCDVYLGGALVVPAAPGPPSVVVIYDCLPFRDYGAKPGADGRYLRRWMRRSVARADRVIAISEFTAGECRRFLPASDPKLRVVTPGLDSGFLEGATAADLEAAKRVLAAAGVDDRCFVLAFGGVQPHKGAGVAAEAMEQLLGRGHDLAMVMCGRVAPAGQPAWLAQVGMVDDSALRGLYARAAAVCVASTHEGFGLTALEAMAMGTPVASTRAGALPEAGGEFAFYAAPGDVTGMADALESALTPSTDGRRRADARRHAAAFSWERSAAAVAQVLDEVAPGSLRSTLREPA
jgi:glycosyltransferase involved in cell wall biosynthesis